MTPPGAGPRSGELWRVILWDLDGTLVDTKEDLAQAINLLLLGRGHAPLTVEQVSSHVGKGARNLVARCLEERGVRGLGSEESDAALAEFSRHYDAHLLDRSRFYPGLLELLGGLRARGQRMAVATNKPEGFSRRLLEGLGGLSHFDAIVGAESTVPQRKPDPGPLLHAMRLADPTAAPRDCLMVGDSAIDVEAGRNAGMPVCGVGWGLGPSEEVFAAGPAYGVRSTDELARALLAQDAGSGGSGRGISGRGASGGDSSGSDSSGGGGSGSDGSGSDDSDR